MNNHPVKVLLVDSDTAAAQSLNRKLADSKRTAYAIRSTQTLSEGLEALAKERFHIALVDFGVPDSSEDTLELVHQVLARAAETPVVIMSSEFDEALALEAVRSGAQDYVVKTRLNSPALERIVLYGIERQRASLRTNLQYSVSRILTEADSLADASSDLLRVGCEYLEFDLGQLWCSDPLTDHLEFMGAWHLPDPDLCGFVSASRQVHFGRGEGLPGRVWHGNAPAWISDIAADHNCPRREAAAVAGLHSAFAFPITVGAENLGVIEFFSALAREPDNELLKVVCDLGNQIGQFIARKIAEQEKNQLTQERLLILDSASEGIYGIDLKGSLSFINRSAAALFRCAPADVLGRDAHDLFHPHQRDGSPRPPEACPICLVLLSGQGCHVGDESFRHFDGSQFAVEYSAYPMLRASQITGAVICFNDVTEKKNMEVDLRHAQKLEAVGGLAAGIAHEINTPIQFIGDNTRFLQDSFRDCALIVEHYEAALRSAHDGKLDVAALESIAETRRKTDWAYLETEIPKALDQMLDGVNRVATIVRAMKEFSHVDRSAEKSAADLNKALESTLIVARNELKYVAEVETAFDALPPVICHLGDLNQVFLNLFVNAAHAIADVVKDSEKKGLIRVTSRLDGDYVEIRVSDSGTGIPEGIRQKVFEPFFTTKAVGKGTGQGLALARAIVVEKHGGTLTFETEVGQGTTFIVRLPVDGPRVPQAVLVT